MRIGTVGVVALVLLSATVVWQLTGDDSELAGEAVVTASSTAPGFSPRDVVSSGSPTSPGSAWQADGETVGAWIELKWDRPHDLRRISVVRNPLGEPGLTEGYFSFGDGSFLQIALSRTERETEITFSPRKTDRVRFTATAVSDDAPHATVAEIVVGTGPGSDDVDVGDHLDGNEAPNAVATQATDVGGSHAAALQDGTGLPGAAGVGSDWTVVDPQGDWVQLDWDRPRELTSIQLVGSAASEAMLAAATLTFGDGAELPVGAVLPQPDRPTVVSFMPRVTRSIRLTVDRVDGAGSLTLGEFRAYRQGAAPIRATPSGGPVSPRIESGDCASADADKESALVIQCPPAGSAVDDRADFRVRAEPGYSAVTATVWPADEAAAAGPVVRAVPDASGEAKLTVDLSSTPPGPLIVRFEATGAALESRIVFFPLYRPGVVADDVDPPSAQAAGRTLTYAEEFSGPISLSRTGRDADYAASKPTHDGVQDFGDAIFADPREGFGNIGVVDNSYLRIGVQPAPAGYADPDGWGRTYLGGLLASARPGGSGFSAQYGYYEARMAASAGPGTWPAFWMLPSDNLIAPTPAVAEIDAVEQYGHNPRALCHTTHEYRDGRDEAVARCGERFASDRAALSWHTYGVAVLPTGITYYVDGAVVATAPQVEGGGAPMFFLVDLALGGGWPVDLVAEQDRAVLYVDYLRVYV
jgi:hypothetical protein